MAWVERHFIAKRLRKAIGFVPAYRSGLDPAIRACTAMHADVTPATGVALRRLPIDRALLAVKKKA
ncbi:hypothetical protein ACQR16_21170 [Bradyrhizobium oligotrophicum]|uniref:hypothetical protein n=1 Tax=Bradyrhizobium oligotrophicum TaxID=44255 RepID=UPI003EBD2D0C